MPPGNAFPGTSWDKEPAMASWKELPGSLSPHARRLVVGLRSLKDHSELSLTALERRSSYSSSSWERYLNGKKLPPARAVEELAALGRGDRDRLLALHSLAAGRWDDGPEPSSRTEPGKLGELGKLGKLSANGNGNGDRVGVGVGDGAATGGGGAAADGRSRGAAGDGRGASHSRREWPRWTRHPLVPGTIGALLVLLTAAVWVWYQERGTEGPDDFAFTPGVTYPCEVSKGAGDGTGEGTDGGGGGLTAGYSDARDSVLLQLVTSWDVVEAQCLLEHHGYPVGEVDGAYDALTERAVKRFQERTGGMVVDGVIGQHTWEELRG